MGILALCSLLRSAREPASSCLYKIFLLLPLPPLFLFPLTLSFSVSFSIIFFIIYFVKSSVRHSVLPLENSNLCLSFSLSVGQSVYLSVCYGIHTLSLSTCRSTFTVSAVLNDIRTFPSKFRNIFHGNGWYFFLYKIYRKWNTFA